MLPGKFGGEIEDRSRRSPEVDGNAKECHVRHVCTSCQRNEAPRRLWADDYTIFNTKVLAHTIQWQNPRTNSSNPLASSRTLLHVKQPLQMLSNKLPLLLIHFIAIKFFQRIDTRAGNLTIQSVLLLQLSAVHRLVWAFDFHSYAGLAFFAERDLLVVAFDGCPVVTSKYISGLWLGYGRWTGKGRGRG